MKYGEEFKKEAVKLSYDIGLKKASENLVVPYETISVWRNKERMFGQRAVVGSGNRREPLSELERLRQENCELRKSRDILKRAFDFFMQDQRKGK
jgi:transposase